MASLPYHYFAELDVSGYSLFVRLNGFGILTPWRGVMRTVIPVNPWIVDGVNTIEITLLNEQGDAVEAQPTADGDSPDKGAEEAPAPMPARWFFAAIGLERNVAIGAMPGENAPEMLCDIGGTNDGVAAFDFPIEMSTEFLVQSPLPRWRWQDAAAVSLDDDSERASLQAFLSKVHNHAASRDVDAMMNLLAGVIAETAAAYDQPLTSLTAELRALFADAYGRTSFRAASLDVEQLDPRAHCGGRVIELVDHEGRPLIAESDADNGWVQPLFVSRLAGASDWSVVAV